MEQELAYSFHLGSDKNKSKLAKKVAKENVSGTTSLANNAIQTAKDLSDANKHNLRDYDNQRELIRTIYGTNDFKLLKLKIPYFPNIEYRKEIFGYKSTKYFPKTPKTNVITKIIIVLAFTKLFLKVLIIIKSVDDKNNIGTLFLNKIG